MFISEYKLSLLGQYDTTLKKNAMNNFNELEKELIRLQNTSNFYKAQELFLMIIKLKKQGMRLGNAH